MKTYEFKDMLLESEIIKTLCSIEREDLLKQENIFKLMQQYKYTRENGISKYIETHVYHPVQTHVIIELVSNINNYGTI